MKDEFENPDIRARTYQFSLRIIKLCRALGNDNVGRVLFNQLLRSGTSIGANVEEAKAGQRAKKISSPRCP